MWYYCNRAHDNMDTTGEEHWENKAKRRICNDYNHVLSLHADGKIESGSCHMILNHHVKQRETRHADLTSMISCDIIDNVKQGKGMKTLFDR